MGLQLLPTEGLNDLNFLRRVRETINNILTFTFDDSRRRTKAEALAGVTPINYAYAPYNVLRYGADPTGAAASDAALNNAIAAAAQANHNTVLIPHGQYLFTTEIVIGYGIMIVAEGSQGTTAPYGTVLMHDSTGNFLKWDGSGGSGFRGTGGGLKNFTILKATGKSGGIAIYLYAGDDNHRPGEMFFENVLVFGDGTGLWAKAIEVDGRNANTAGARGVRTTHWNKVRVADCTTDYQYVHLRQATHVYGNIQIDTGDGTGQTGMTIADIWDNIFLELRVGGRIVVDYSGSDLPALILTGKCDLLDINYVDTVGNVLMEVGTTITNQAKLISIASFKADAFYGVTTANQSNVTGDGTQYTVLYDTERFDRNSSFNPATGIFTANTAGLYQFNYAVTLDDVAAGHSTAVLNLLHQDNTAANVNNIDMHGGNIGAIPDAGGAITLRNSVLLQLSEGDTVKVRITVSGGAKVVDVVGAATTRYTYFMGKLLA